MSNRPYAWPEEKRQRLFDLWTTTDMSQAAVAREMGISKNAVAGQLDRLGLKRRGKAPPPPATPKRERNHKRIRAPKSTLPPQDTPPPLSEPPPPPRDPPPPRRCAWPTTNGRPWRFCEAEVAPGAVYCPEHRAIARGQRAA